MGGRLVREMCGEINGLCVCVVFLVRIIPNKNRSTGKSCSVLRKDYLVIRIPDSLIFETQLTSFFVESP